MDDLRLSGINPASGLPMVTSSLDVAGHVYGTGSAYDTSQSGLSSAGLSDSTQASRAFWIVWLLFVGSIAAALIVAFSQQ